MRKRMRAWGRARMWFWVMAALAVSCAPALPSTTPLGRGPLAASTVEAPEPPPAASGLSAQDAAAESTAPDAGAQDAGDASGKTAEAGTAAAAAVEPDESGRPQEIAAPSQPAVAFAGHYAGEDAATFHIATAPARPQKDPNAKLDVTRKSGAVIEVTLIDSGTGNPICTLEGTASGNTAKLNAGQHCFDKTSPGAMTAMTATLDTGAVTVNGARLVLDMHLDLEVSAAGQQITGKLDYHFEGSRQ